MPFFPKESHEIFYRNYGIRLKYIVSVYGTTCRLGRSVRNLTTPSSGFVKFGRVSSKIIHTKIPKSCFLKDHLLSYLTVFIKDILQQ